MDDPETPEPPGPPRPNSGVVLGLVALALVLAVGFFYLTNFPTIQYNPLLLNFLDPYLLVS